MSFNDPIYNKISDITFLTASILGLTGAILSLIFPIPNPEWIIIFPFLATFLYVLTFLFALLSRPFQHELVALYYLFGLGSFALFISALLTLTHFLLQIADYTKFLNLGIMGTSLFIIGDFFLFFNLFKDKFNKRETVIFIFVYLGTISLFISSIISLLIDGKLSHLISVIGFVCLVIVGVLHFVRRF